MYIICVYIQKHIWGIPLLLLQTPDCRLQNVAGQKDAFICTTLIDPSNRQGANAQL